MITHEALWRGIDRIAHHLGLSTSALSKRCGFDPTALNISKRVYGKEQRKRWPSSDTIVSILNFAHLDFSDLQEFMNNENAGDYMHPPMITENNGGLVNADGIGASEHVRFPGVRTGPGSYAMRVESSDYEPIYRYGSVVIAEPAKEVREGDRVVVRMGDKLVLARLDGFWHGDMTLSDIGRHNSIGNEPAEFAHRITYATQ